MIVETSSALASAFTNVWANMIAFVPNILVAIIVFVVGWILGAIAGRIVAQIVKAIKLDKALDAAGLDDFFRKGGFDLNAGSLLGGLVKWFIIIVFLVGSLEILGLTQVNAFLNNVVLLYLPQVIVAVLIMLIAAVIADFVQGLVAGSARAAGMVSAKLFGGIAKWAIWIFAGLVALSQLQVGTAFLETLFMGVVVALSLGFGLAFGLGGQEAAARYLEKMRTEVFKRD
jgi:hypothetical protein